MKTILEFLQKKKITKAIADSEYEAVDLGLSVKWSSCNVGATKPEELGLLFQWGRTDGYKYGDTNHGFLPKRDYVTTSVTEYKVGEILKPEDDAAHVNMKGGWRMPTKKEIEELLKLPHKWTELNGVKGYEFTGENENSIFIPAAGSFNGYFSSFGNSDRDYMWSSSACSDNANDAYNLTFDSDDCYTDHYCRYNGFSVRGVCE